ncbi:MAG TPA: DNA topology modulation protein [Pyrinomonadaceae bacterium]|nr:DNA topology modulation protein [Pyrinomonadaceae bacterium]
MKKVLVIGPGGAGKSTFARRLGELLGIEVLHLDKFYWHPGWVETPKPEWLKQVEEMVKGDAWIMDGNYSGTLDVRLEACDTVVFMDMPRTLCLRRVIKRALMYRKTSRPDVAEGCQEKLNLEFLLWIWNYPRRSRPKIVRMLEARQGEKRIVWLRSPAEVESFLATCAETNDRSSSHL